LDGLLGCFRPIYFVFHFSHLCCPAGSRFSRFLFFPPNPADFTNFYFILLIALPVGTIFASIYYYKSHIEKYMANVH
jgi:hypothetical protein